MVVEVKRPTKPSNQTKRKRRRSVFIRHKNRLMRDCLRALP